jgi:Tol biopolymer transport system component
LAAELDTTKQTRPGLVMGTVQYMSPEQAMGKAVDRRTDIFSLGVVMYEMATGRLPFEGESVSETIDRIVHAQPEAIARWNPDVPWELERIIRKCLEKERGRRYQHARELVIDLKNLKRDSASGEKAHRASWIMNRKPGHESRVTATAALAVAALVIVAAIGMWFWRFGGSKNEASLPLRHASFAQLTAQAGEEFFPSLSPDGASFVYASRTAGNWDIYFRRVSGQNPINVTQASPADDTQPAFSPDGERIAFRSERGGGGIFIMGATGESARRLTDFGYNPAWSPDGKEIACATENILNPLGRSTVSQLWSVNVATGEKRLIAGGDVVQPAWSPRGSRIAYWGNRKNSWRDIWTIPAGGGEPVPVTNDAAVDWNPVWSADGRHLYFVSDRNGSMNVWRIPINEGTGHVLGPPALAATPSVYSQHISCSRDGRSLIYVQAIERMHLRRIGFDPVGETVVGHPVPISQSLRQARNPQLSPDQQWLAFDSQGDPQEDIFIIRTDGTQLHQLTDDPHKDRLPRWSPDGRRLAFYSNRSGSFQLWTVSPDGSGLQQLTDAPDQVAFYPTWSPDARRLAFNLGVSPRIMDAERPWNQQTPQTLPALDDPQSWFNVWSWSPDGRRLAGWQEWPDGRVNRTLLYDFASGQFETLTDFGTDPGWLSDNRRLLFLHQDRLYLVDSRSKKTHEVLSLELQGFGRFCLTRDDRLIYFDLITNDADIWLMTLEP